MKETALTNLMKICTVESLLKYFIWKKKSFLHNSLKDCDKKYQFSCYEKCIPKWKFQDGKVDCSNGQDESKIFINK